jgi:hypothetical protein
MRISMSKRRKSAFLSPTVLVALIGLVGVVISAYLNYLANVKPPLNSIPTVSPTVAPRDWYVIFSYEFPENYWKDGIHNYLFKANCPFSINSTKSNESSYSLTIKKDTEILSSMVYIRRGHLYLEEVGGTPISSTINPAQPTTAIYGPLAENFEDAKRLQNECKVQISIDDGSFIDLTADRIDKIK